MIIAGAALLLFGAGLGAGTGFASSQVQDTLQRRVLLDIAESRLQLANLRYEMASQDVELQRARASAGIVDQEVATTAAAGLNEIQADLDRIKLEMEEIPSVSRNDEPFTSTRRSSRTESGNTYCGSPAPPPRFVLMFMTPLAARSP